GRSTLAALDVLDADPATELIVVVSKPPAPEVAARVTGHAQRLRTPVRFALLGPGRPDLTAVVEALGYPVPTTWPAWQPTADPDPAAALAPAIAAAGRPVVVSVTGTAADPQGLARQAQALCDAGAAVFLSNAQAARFAAGLVR